MDRTKALKLSRAMRSVVADLLHDRLRVGRGLCFREGQPHCSFGHALSRAGFSPATGLDILSNEDGLFAYLGWDDHLTCHGELLDLTAEVEWYNDRGDLSSAASSLDQAASLLESEAGL